jgi:hypothetical protein
LRITFAMWASGVRTPVEARSISVSASNGPCFGQRAVELLGDTVSPI